VAASAGSSTGRQAPAAGTTPEGHCPPRYNFGVSDAEPGPDRAPDRDAETTPADTDGTVAAGDRAAAAAKARGFPQTPGVYLMKDAAGR
jgi:hypothetical protein